MCSNQTLVTIVGTIVRFEVGLFHYKENSTHLTAHAPEKIFQRKLQYFFSCYNLIIKKKEKIYKLPEQNKLNKTAWLKYAIRRRNGG